MSFRWKSFQPVCLILQLTFAILFFPILCIRASALTDISVPIRSNGSPQGILSLNTTSTVLSLSTNEAAACRYATVQDISYASMSNTFQTSDGSLHSIVVSGLVGNMTYTYYVRCEDMVGNVNTDDYPVVFSVGGATVHIDIQNPAASDTNPGTQSLPFKTISRAISAAIANKTNNVATKVLVYPGTYRESVSLFFNSNQKEAPIVFEAAQTGKVIVSGSDIWTGWKKKPNTNIYTRKWPYNWGLASYPGGWAGNVTLKNIVRRREMIFINGKPLTQVLSYAALKENSFYVSEVNDTVYIWSLRGTNIGTATIEVSIRSGIFAVYYGRNITLRGFTFRHDNTPVDGDAVRFATCSNITIEDSTFHWNNWGGLAFYYSHNVTARRNIANYNGGRGMGAYEIKTLLFENNETSYNNWRGVTGGFTVWSVAGLKHMLIHDGIYRGHKSLNNQTGGFWLDTDNTNVLIENAFYRGNLTNGIFIEATQGPLTLRNSAICGNNLIKDYFIGPGVITGNSTNITLEGNVIYGNGASQVGITGGEPERTVQDWETGEIMNLKTELWTIRNNVIMGKNSSQKLIDIRADLEDAFLANLISDNNIWYNPYDSNVFSRVGGTVLTNLSGWQSLTTQDFNSVFANPQTVGSAAQKFLISACDGP